MSESTIKYIFVDDEDQDRVQALADVVAERHNDLEINVMHPAEFFAKLDALSGTFQGLILDLRLDQKANTRGEFFPFRAFALAQELRTRATEAGAKGYWSVPIVVWSTERNLLRSFAHDETAHDLLDAKYEKTGLASNDSVARELVALAHGYAALVKTVDMPPTVRLARDLGLDEDEVSAIDVRLVSETSELAHPIHNRARFLLRQVVQRTGPLLDESVLAARLGVDPASVGWPGLKAALDEVSYTGVFRSGWPRWWSHRLENWWFERESRPLSNVVAEERVAVLASHFPDLELDVWGPIEDRYSTRYWTVCEGSRLDRSDSSVQPLDPIDGVRVAEPEPAPWQMHRYISMWHALNRTGRSQGLRPHPAESVKLEMYKGRG